MRSLLTFPLLVFLLLAGCDSTPTKVEDATTPQTITYRVASDAPLDLKSITWIPGALDGIAVLSDVKSPWEIDIPYFVGLKAISTNTIRPDQAITVSILVDGETIAENHFPASPGNGLIVGAIGGAPQYRLQYRLRNVDPHTELSLKADGLDLHPTWGLSPYDDDGFLVIEGERTFSAPAKITFTKGEGQAVGGALIHHVGLAFLLYDMAGDEPYEMSLSLSYDGR